MVPRWSKFSLMGQHIKRVRRLWDLKQRMSGLFLNSSRLARYALSPYRACRSFYLGEFGMARRSLHVDFSWRIDSRVSTQFHLVSAGSIF